MNWKDLEEAERENFSMLRNELVSSCKGRLNQREFADIAGLMTKSVSTLDLQPFYLGSKHFRSLRQALPLTSDVAWLIGLYVAEGSPSIVNGRVREPEFSLSYKETHLANRIVQICQALGYSTHIRRQKSALHVLIYSRVLGLAFCTWCGRGAINKHFPDFILQNKDLKIAEACLEGYFTGDGNQYGTTKRICTISERLAGEVRIILSRLGYKSSKIIGPEAHRGTILGREVNLHQRFTVAWNANKVVNLGGAPRRLICFKGHLLLGDNISEDSQGNLRCRICRDDYSRQRSKEENRIA